MQVSLIEASANLNNLVEAAINGEEIILLNGDCPVAKITSIAAVANIDTPNKKYRTAGTMAGMIIMADDFDEPLAELEGYMN